MSPLDPPCCLPLPPRCRGTLVTGAPGGALQVAGQKLLGGGWEQHARTPETLGTKPSRVHGWGHKPSCSITSHGLTSTAGDSPRTGHPGAGCSLGHGAADDWGPRHDFAPMHRIPNKHPLPALTPATYLLPRVQGDGMRLLPPASAESQPG